MFDKALTDAPFSLPQVLKERDILAGLNALVRHHHAACPGYARIIDRAWGGLRHYDRLSEVPYLPVSLFKEIELSSTSVPAMIMQSSGTTGQATSKIIVDHETALRQSRALMATFKPVLGEKRLPFLVVDTKDVIKASGLTARGAGVLGMMKFGAKTTFALDSDLTPDRDTIRKFLASNGDQPFLIFGFTFLVWTKLYQCWEDGEIDLSNAILIHSGGWKKLEAEKVSNATFRKALARRFGLTSVYNFYGFVEQIGSIFLEGEDGLLYPPNFTDVIVRRRGSLDVADMGEEGLLQVMSLLPKSYPGMNVLTEDLGVIESVDSGVGGRWGKAIRVTGRLPRSELRGCSDVIAAQAESP